MVNCQDTMRSLQRFAQSRLDSIRRHAISLHEPVQPLPGPDQPVPLARQPLDGRGVVLQRVDPRSQPRDLGLRGIETRLLGRQIRAQPPQLEQRVLAAEEREVDRPREQDDANDNAGLQKASRPGYSAAAPRSSLMRSSWLYLATRSVRLALPVLI